MQPENREAFRTEARNSQPHVLFITCHDLGQHLGCYGQSTVTSPALDRLAAEGVRFARSFCTAPQCSPSRASLHTGLYPHSAGVLGLAHRPFGWRLDPRVPHTAQLLAQAGYATCLVGMQHLIDRGSARELGYASVLPVAPAYEEADAAVGLLGELSRGSQPFYLEVGFEEPHRPYDFGGAQPDAARGIAIPGYLPDAPETRRDLAAFQGAIRQMDAGVGRILAGLEALGIDQTTCVIFATDHGAAMPRAKCTLYDPGIEVALLWRWPSAGQQGGRVVSELISNVDVTPSLLEGLGVPVPSELHGRSFWPVLSGGSYAPRSEVFAEKTFHTYYEPMRAIRTDRHKLIVNFEVSTRVDVPADIRESPIYPLMLRDFDGIRPTVELYDLVEDPWERHNLAGSAEVSRLEAELRERLRRWMESTADPLLRGPVASPYYTDTLAWLSSAA
jgi:arylsulfatase A-like enzyme